MDTGNVYMWSMIWELKWLLLLLFCVLAVYVIGKMRLQLRELFRDVIYDIRNSSIGVYLTLLPIITTLSYPQDFDGVLAVYAWIIFIFIIYIFVAYKIGGSIADFGPPEKWTVVILALFSAILTALPMEFVLSFFGDLSQVSYSTPALTMRDTFLGILEILFTVSAFFMFALPFVGRGIHNKASSVA